MEHKIERKCASCKEWNNGNLEDCLFCGVPISPQKIINTRAKEFKISEEEKPLTRIDAYLNKIKSHPNLAVRIVFNIVYSTWVVFMFIVSVIVYVVALTPG